jgi:hypothetical protein
LQSNCQIQAAEKGLLKTRYGPGKKPLSFFFKQINLLKKQLKSENNTISNKRKAESLLYTEIHLITRSDEDARKKYLFTSSETSVSCKTTQSAS